MDGLSDSEYALSSSNYNKLSVLEMQLAFQKQDLVQGEINLPHIISEKGCCATQHALSHFQKIS